MQRKLSLVLVSAVLAFGCASQNHKGNAPNRPAAYGGGPPDIHAAPNNPSGGQSPDKVPSSVTKEPNSTGNGPAPKK